MTGGPVDAPPTLRPLVERLRRAADATWFAGPLTEFNNAEELRALYREAADALAAAPKEAAPQGEAFAGLPYKDQPFAGLPYKDQPFAGERQKDAPETDSPTARVEALLQERDEARRGWAQLEAEAEKRERNLRERVEEAAAALRQALIALDDASASVSGEFALDYPEIMSQWQATLVDGRAALARLDAETAADSDLSENLRPGVDFGRAGVAPSGGDAPTEANE